MLTRLEARPVKRILGCFSGQKGSVQMCPDLPLLKGKTALVTGPTSGIGRETVAGCRAGPMSCWPGARAKSCAP